MYRHLSFFEFSSVIWSQWVLPSKFSLLWYQFLISIRNLSVTWPLPGRELSRLGEPKRLHEEKLSRFPGLPYLPRWDNSLTRVVSPPETGVRDPDVNGWLILQRNKLKLTSARVTRGEGCLGCPETIWMGPNKIHDISPICQNMENVTKKLAQLCFFHFLPNVEK